MPISRLDAKTLPRTPTTVPAAKLPQSLAPARARVEQAISLARRAIAEGTPTPVVGPLNDKKLQGQQLDSVKRVLESLERADLALGGDPSKVKASPGTYASAGWAPGAPASNDTAPIRDALFGASQDLLKLLTTSLKGKSGADAAREAYAALSDAHRKLTL